MSRRRKRGDEPTLFDLPLDGPVEPTEPIESIERAEQAEPSRQEDEPEADAASDSRSEGPRLPFEPPPPSSPPPRREPAQPDWAEPARPPVPLVEPSPASPSPGPVPEAPRPDPDAAPLSVRYLAGLADLAVHAALAIALLFGARLLGVRAGLGDWLPLTLFLLVFSFFYTVLPLAFWGQTPGMAWAGVVARASTGESLTFPQTALRWIGGIVTVALLGLPVLLAVGGRRSLTDRVSDADTVLAD